MTNSIAVKAWKSQTLTGAVKITCTIVKVESICAEAEIREHSTTISDVKSKFPGNDNCVVCVCVCVCVHACMRADCMYILTKPS